MKRLIDFSSRFRILKGGKISLVVSALLGSITLSFASPSGGNVVSGSATISQNGTVTNINQNTAKASINWQTFSVAKGETVNFNQPDASSITLNRVVGNEKSVIDGALNANGQVWLLNSNGVLFSKNASINTSGILATTAELSDKDFQDGNYNFKNSSSASVINQGTINIKNAGSVILASNEVINEGTIKATKGKVHLVGADSYSINLNGNSLVNLRVDKGVLDAMVKNSGHIVADGGEIYLTTNAVDELLRGVVNNTGIIEANSVDDLFGSVEMFAHGGEVQVGGTIEAEGGFVETSGKDFAIQEGTEIKAGEWLIDPVDITIDDTLSTTIETALASGDVTIETTTSASTVDTSSNETSDDGDTTDGDIYVNSDITWFSSNKLTLNAADSIYINANIFAYSNLLGDAQLALYYGQGAVESGNTSNYYVNAPITISSGDNFFTKLGSDGAETTWTVVTTASDLMNISKTGNSVLGADVDASGITSWTPIGDYSTKFTGDFDGLGHTIDNLTIDNDTLGYIGLFGYTNDATIRNVGLTNANIFTINNMAYVGGLVGRASSSTVSNSYTSGTSVSGGEYSHIGGLVASASSSTISNSYTSETSVLGLTGGYIGGLVGAVSSSTVSNSYVRETSVSGLTDAYIGGLVAYTFSSTISNSYSSTTSISSGGNGLIGGLLGHDDSSTISNSYYDNEANTGNMDDSSLGKTKAEILALISDGTWDETIWSEGGGSSVEGYELTELPYLTNVTQEADKPYTYTLFNGGFGTSDDAYEITNWTQLQNINNSNILTQDYYFSLLNDLDSSTSDYAELASSTANSGAGWNPIGSASSGYAGTFDGLGYTIDALTIDRSSESYIGLFGFTRSTSVINNVGLTNIDVTGDNEVGGLVGFNLGKVTNSFTTGSVTGDADIGGLVGNNDNTGIITHSYSKSNIYSNTSHAGGLVGLNNGGEIANTYATGSVNAASNVGGLVGSQDSDGSISNSYSTGAVTWRSGLRRDGLLGSNFSGTVENSFWDTQTSGVSHSVFSVAEGKTTVELQTPSTFSTWDDTIWSFQIDGAGDSVEGYETAKTSYPFLTNVTTEADKPTDGISSTLFAGGFGTSDDAYEITNWTELQNINNSNVLTQDYYFSLLNDLDSSTSDYTELASSTANSGAGWNPIGTSTAFIGSFDGQDYVISDLYINDLINSRVGLFAYISSSTIENLGLENIDITGNGYVGGLVGNISDSDILNTYTTGSIEGTAWNGTGGLVGYSTNGSSINSSYSSATVSGIQRVGGLVGFNHDGSSIYKSYALGNVIDTTTNGTEFGGLVGLNQNATVSKSYATGDVTGGTYSNSVGGLIGENDNGTVIRSYATGDVSGFLYIGGLIGVNFQDSVTNKINESYSTGSVTSGSGIDGGLVAITGVDGFSEEGPNIEEYSQTDLDTIITNSYWDSETSGKSTSSGGTALTTAEFLDSSNFSAWDSEDWLFTDSLAEGYGIYLRPYLINITRDEDKSMTTLFAGGFGTSDDAYEITNWTQLQNINNSNILSEGYYFGLLNSLDSSTSGYTTEVKDGDTLANGGIGWNPIGGELDTNTYQWSIFKGVFDGMNNTIDSLLVNYSGYTGNQTGLFGRVEDSNIKNLGVTNLNITSDNISGGLVGQVQGENVNISNSYSTGTMSGNSSGGLVGNLNKGKIDNSYSSVNLSDGSGLGGLVKAMSSGGEINNSYSTGNIQGTSMLGGLVANISGDSTTKITNSYATGNVTGTIESIGGLVGYADGGFISNSYASGTVSGNNFVGGLIGNYFNVTAENSFYNSANTDTGVGTGITLSQFEFGKIFDDASWDIVADSSVTSSTPVLKYDSVNDTYYWAIAPITLSYTLSDETSIYNGDTQALSDFYTTSSIFGDDYIVNSVNKLDGAYSFQENNSDVTGYKNAGDYENIKVVSNSDFLTIADSGNTDGNLTIDKKALTISGLSSQDKVYDGTLSATVNGTASLQAFEAVGDGTTTDGKAYIGDDVSLSGTALGTFNDKNVSDATTVSFSGLTLTGAQSENYTVAAHADANANISKANATVTANSDTTTYNGTEQSVDTFTASGLVNGETIAVLDGVSASGSGTNAGTYTTTASGTDENYNLTFVDGSLVINKADAIVTADSNTTTYNGLSQSVNTFTASGLVNGETIAVLDGVSASGSGTNAGTYTISAAGSDENYNLTFIDGSLVINKADAIVTADSNTTTYNGIAQGVNTFTASGLVNGETISVLDGVSTSGSGTNAGTYTTTASGSDENYNLTFVDGSLVINPKSITVSADDLSKIIGNEDPALTYIVEGLIGSDALQGVLQRASGEAVGDYTISQGSLANSNYSITFNNGIFTIEKSSSIEDVISSVTNSVTTTPVVPVVGNTPLPISTGNPINLVSRPLESQATTMVTMSQLQTSNGNGNTPTPNNDIRVPVGENSIVQLVNGGVNLPAGVEQQFFVVDNEN